MLTSTAERIRLSEASRERAKSFAVSRVAAETDAVYRELLDDETANRIEPDLHLNISNPPRELAASAVASPEGELL